MMFRVLMFVLCFCFVVIFFVCNVLDKDVL